MENIEEVIARTSLYTVGIASVLLFVFTGISLTLKKPGELVKKLLFGAIVLTSILPTLYFAISTFYVNTISSSKGPVHWHADFEVWACGREIELVDPKGLSNKIGTNTLHEHNDKRIHLEGVVITPPDASLGKFFDVVGGHITGDSLSLPTEKGLLTYRTGDACENGGLGEVQVFVFRTTKNNNYYQEKVTNPENYIISPYGNVPTGDCVIVEFGERKLRTERLCRSYKVAKQIGKLEEEVFPIK